MYVGLINIYKPFFYFCKIFNCFKDIKKRYTLKLNLAISLKYLVFYKNKKMASRY